MSLVALTSWGSKIRGPHSPVSSIPGLHNPTPGTPGLPNSRSQHPTGHPHPTSSLHVPNLLGPHTPQKQAAPPRSQRRPLEDGNGVPPPPTPCQGVPAPLCPLLSPRGDASGGWGGGSTPSPGPSSGPGAMQRGGHAPCAPHVPVPQRRGLGLALHGHRQQIPLIPPESSRRQAAGDPGGILRLGGPAASPPPPTASSCPPPPPRCACCAILGTGGHGNRRDGDGCHRESSSSIGDQQPELVGDGDGGVGGCCPPPRSTQPLAGCSAPI